MCEEGSESKFGSEEGLNVFRNLCLIKWEESHKQREVMSLLRDGDSFPLMLTGLGLLQ